MRLPVNWRMMLGLGPLWQSPPLALPVIKVLRILKLPVQPIMAMPPPCSSAEL